MDFLSRQILSVTVEKGLQNIHFKTKDMRIKINDKIYRLKEIESGVDSLMELVEEPKFKKGDKVMLKSGCKSRGGLLYLTVFDQYIGDPLTVLGYTESGNVFFDEFMYKLDEEWLEPYEELKKGDLAIFWDEDKKYAVIRFYDRPNESEECFRYKDKMGNVWANAIKFESKEQYERLIRGEK